MVASFEELTIWKLSRQLTNEIYKIDFKNNLGLKDQICRASVSIMSNIAEGYERGGNQEFMQFLYIAKGSCGEVRSQLYVANDNGYINEYQFYKLAELARSISKMVSRLINHLKNSHIKGIKYKRLERPSVKEITEKILNDLNFKP